MLVVQYRGQLSGLIDVGERIVAFTRPCFIVHGLITVENEDLSHIRGLVCYRGIVYTNFLFFY